MQRKFWISVCIFYSTNVFLLEIKLVLSSPDAGEIQLCHLIRSQVPQLRDEYLLVLDLILLVILDAVGVSLKCVLIIYFVAEFRPRYLREFGALVGQLIDLIRSHSATASVGKTA